MGPRLGSKRTAREPERRDKHFVVLRRIPATEATHGEAAFEVQAVLSRRTRIVAAHDLCDPAQWRAGWH